MTEKTERVTIRIPSHLDKQIQKFAREYYPTVIGGDYSKAVRFLCQMGLIVSNRLDKETITTFLAEEV